MGKLKALALEYGRFAASDGRFGALLTSRQGSNAQVTPGGVTLKRTVSRPRGRDAVVWPRARYLATVRRLLADGAPHQGPVFHWNLTAKSKHPCLAPRWVARVAAYKTDRQSVGWLRPMGAIHLFGRCRECEACLLHRRNLWISRVVTEARACPGRMWFVTINCDPEFREYLDLDAARRAHRAREIFSRLDAREKFRFRADALAAEASLYVKRLRKGYGRKAPCRFRFVCVVEPHEDWFPHAHFVVYEHGGAPLQERLFRARWRGRGMARANLVDGPQRVAAYVSKYITKSGASKVWASVLFGRPRPEQGGYAAA